MATIYIDPYLGDDTNSGTLESSPKKTIGTVQNNNNYLLKRGVSITVTSAIDCTSKTNVIFGDYGDQNLPLPELTASGSSAIFVIGGTASGVTVKGLRISTERVSSLWAAISVATTAGPVIIEDNEFVGNKNATGGVLVAVDGSKNVTGLTVRRNSFEYGFRGVASLISSSSIIHSNISIEDNVFLYTRDAPIRFSVESAGYTTSYYNGITIKNNVIDTCAGPVWVRTGNPDYSNNEPIIRSTNILIDNNVVMNSADTEATNHSAIAVGGCESPIISNNFVKNCKTQGALIQTAANNNITIENNYCEKAVVTENIDGLGIFIDNRTNGGVCRFNRVHDCPGYGGSDPNLTNYGGGIGLWQASNCEVHSNIVTNSRYGFSYGQLDEVNNKIYNNLAVSCSVAGVYQHGSGANTVTSLEFFNNHIVNCGTLWTGKVPVPLTINMSNNLVEQSINGSSLIMDEDEPIGINLGSSSEFYGKSIGKYLTDYNGVDFYHPPSAGAFSIKRIGNPFK